MTKVDIVIVGGGIVGATLAALIQRSALAEQYRVLLLDASPVTEVELTGAFDPRVVALSLTSKDILTQVDAWPIIESTRLCPYKSMRVWDADGTGSVEFLAEDVQQANLGHIVENKVVLQALTQVLAVNRTYEERRGEQLESLTAIDGGYELTLTSGEHIHTALLVGADGARSKVRDLLGFETKTWDYGHTAIVTTVETERSHEFCAWQRFDTPGPLAFLPLSKDGGDSHTSSIVWSIDRNLAEHYMAQEEDEFKQGLARALEHRLGDVTNIDQRVAFPLKQCFATRYVKPSCVLVGDAAHAIHPLAGQGVNMGLYDVKALFEELVRGAQRKIPLSEMATLRRYERARQPHNLMAMAAMEAFKRGFGSNDAVLRYLRNTGMRFVNQQAPIKRFFTSLAAGAR